MWFIIWSTQCCYFLLRKSFLNSNEHFSCNKIELKCFQILEFENKYICSWNYLTPLFTDYNKYILRHILQNTMTQTHACCSNLTDWILQVTVVITAKHNIIYKQVILTWWDIQHLFFSVWWPQLAVYIAVPFTLTYFLLLLVPEKKKLLHLNNYFPN